MNFHQLRLDKKVPILLDVLKRGDYDIFHVHSCFAFDFWMLFVAKKCGVKVRIIHSHNTTPKFRLKATALLNSASKPLLRFFATDYMACGWAAGTSLLGNKESVRKKLIIIENGIDTSKYSPNEEVRNRVRRDLSLENRHVLGSVGRLEQQKNYEFLLYVFKELSTCDSSAVLLIVGSGSEKEKLISLSRDLAIEENVIFLGERNDVPELLQAMDCFALTSLYEGLVISLIEAQCADLNCVAADTITNEANLTGTVCFMSLSDSYMNWAKVINQLFTTKTNYDGAEKIKQAGYDIDASTRKLDILYQKVVA